MKIRNLKSIIIILVYAGMNGGILALSMLSTGTEEVSKINAETPPPDLTIVEGLDYFSLKEGIPHMSLSAESMQSVGQIQSEFKSPKGVYNYREKNESIRYQGLQGTYTREKGLLGLKGEVKMISSDSEYHADEMDYFFERDLVLGRGNVRFVGEDLQTKDEIEVTSSVMDAQPKLHYAHFSINVKGSITRQKKYEGKIDFTSRELYLRGAQSLAQLEGEVWLKRNAHVITAGKGDIYLENYNKTLKYFVLNDDVKVTETLVTPQGTVQRKSYSERLEGFGREQKMVLSGTPRVEQGADVIKGYRITIREDVDLIEVDDAMSDVKVKKEQEKNRKN